MLFPVACVLSVVASAPINLDQSSLLNVAKTIIAKAISYYVPSETGAFPKDNEDGQNVQWFESGIYWGIIMGITFY